MTSSLAFMYYVFIFDRRHDLPIFMSPVSYQTHLHDHPKFLHWFLHTLHVFFSHRLRYPFTRLHTFDVTQI
jgi:hypothetical protein